VTEWTIAYLMGPVVMLVVGIAKLLSRDVSAESPLTEMSVRALTPDYASPEHIAGKVLSTTSDVYSLGVVLYELLAGARPFCPQGASRRDLEEAILTQDPPRPSQSAFNMEVAAARNTTPRKLALALTGDLDTILLKALKKAPAERYLSIGAFAKEHGARLLVENHGGPSSDPAWMGRLLDTVGRDACGLLLDLGNFDVLTAPLVAAFFGDTSGEPTDLAKLFADVDLSDVYDGIESLADHAELVSLKAHHVSEDGTVGPVDLARALKILAAHGYTGPLSVEYEGMGGDPWANSAQVLDVARSVLGTEGR